MVQGMCPIRKQSAKSCWASMKQPFLAWKTPKNLKKNDNDHSFNKVFAGWNVSGIDDEHLKIVVLNLSVDMALPLSMAVSCHFPLIGRHPKKWKEKNRFPHHSQKVWMMQETPV